jgi:hypothetical protein
MTAELAEATTMTTVAVKDLALWFFLVWYGIKAFMSLAMFVCLLESGGTRKVEYGAADYFIALFVRGVIILAIIMVLVFCK